MQKQKEMPVAAVVWTAFFLGLAAVCVCLLLISRAVVYMPNEATAAGFSFFAGLSSIVLGFAVARLYARGQARRYGVK